MKKIIFLVLFAILFPTTIFGNDPIWGVVKKSGPSAVVIAGGEEIPLGGGSSTWGGITGTLSDQTDLQGILNEKSPTIHSHNPSDVAGTAVITTDSRLSDARMPIVHNQDWSTINTGRPTTLSGYGITDAAPSSHVSDSTIHFTQGTIDHTNILNRGTNTHSVIDTHLGSISNPHSTSDANLVTTDITTNNVSITKHGFVPKAPNITTQYLRGDGTWAAPAATGTGYTIKVQALTSSPADAATIYFGMLPKAPTTTAAISKVYIRKAGTIKIAEIYCYSGTAGTNEAWSLYIRLNNTTDTLIATLSVATSERIFSNVGLSISVVAGDYIEIKSINPTWVTNPLTCIFGGYIYIE